MIGVGVIAYSNPILKNVAMYITLESAKKHLQIDEDFKDDDNYITFLI